MRYVTEHGKRYPRFSFKEAWAIQDETCDRMDAKEFDYVAACNRWFEIEGRIDFDINGQSYEVEPPQDRQDPRQAEEYFDFLWQLFDEDYLPLYLQHVFIAILKAGNKGVKS